MPEVVVEEVREVIRVLARVAIDPAACVVLTGVLARVATVVLWVLGKLAVAVAGPDSLVGIGKAVERVDELVPVDIVEVIAEMGGAEVCVVSCSKEDISGVWEDGPGVDIGDKLAVVVPATVVGTVDEIVVVVAEEGKTELWDVNCSMEDISGAWEDAPKVDIVTKLDGDVESNDKTDIEEDRIGMGAVAVLGAIVELVDEDAQVAPASRIPVIV